MKLIKEFQSDTILILVNSTLLRDSNWETEFKKFDLEDVYKDKVLMQTYQYMYKQDDDFIELTENSLIILDEVDFIADTIELSRVMNIFPKVRTLGLTGFITEAKKAWFESHLPVITEYTAHQAQIDGLLNKIHFVFVKYHLSKDPNGIKVEYVKAGEKKHFMQSENNAYEYRHNQFAKAIAQKEMIDADFRNGRITMHEAMEKQKSMDYKMRMVINDRSKLLLNSITAANVSKKILAYLEKENKGKTVVFSKRTAQSVEICGKDRCYNGSQGKKKAKAIFDSFMDGTINVLGVCDKINRGANIDGLRNAILESFFGSDTQATQRFGRLLRLDPDDVATIYVLLPYFMYKHKDGSYSCKETQQVTWARNMLRSTTMDSHETWDYRTVKTTLKK